MKTITLTATVHCNTETVWELWTQPQHIERWNQASDDWYCPHATNDLRVGGKFVATMSARDGSASFDFEGSYTKIHSHSLIEYTIIDGRKVTIEFVAKTPHTTEITETFEIEKTHTQEQQRSGWLAILESFRRYCEAYTK